MTVPRFTATRFDDSTLAIRSNMARALIGRSVSLRSARSRSIVHGRVTDVQMDFGVPRLLVAGVPYDLDQVLTSAPATLPA
jgi:hypothetical protein